MRILTSILPATLDGTDLNDVPVIVTTPTLFAVVWEDNKEILAAFVSKFEASAYRDSQLTPSRFEVVKIESANG